MEIKGLNSTKRRMEQLANLKVEEAVKKATTFIQGQAKELAPYSSVKQSIHMKVDGEGSEIVGTVYTNLSYAPFVEFGTGSVGNGTYTYLVKGLSLKYKDEGWIYTADGGETFYYTEGQVAKPYMYPAFNSGKKYAKEVLKTEIQSQIKTICKGG